MWCSSIAMMQESAMSPPGSLVAVVTVDTAGRNRKSAEPTGYCECYGDRRLRAAPKNSPCCSTWARAGEDAATDPPSLHRRHSCVGQFTPQRGGVTSSRRLVELGLHLRLDAV